MKLMVIGVGDCGCKLAREFAGLNKMARSERHVNIITCAYAINNDTAFLNKVTKTGWDWLKPVPIRGPVDLGDRSTESGVKLMRQEGERVMLAMRLGAFVDTDAFLFVAGASGSIGSGGVPVLLQMLKERNLSKPVYVFLILPRNTELDDPQRIRNAALCLKSIDKVADAVILADNAGLGMLGNAVPTRKLEKLNLDKFNKELVLPFYDLLCSGEMVGSKYAVGKELDAGDIVQTLAGWTAIGVGKAKLASSIFSSGKTKDFEEKSSETSGAVEAMNLALMQLSVDCKLEDSGKALYLLAVPVKQANVEMIKVLGNRLRELAPNAELRDGSFYGAKGFAKVTIIISELIYVDRIKSYYDRAGRLVQGTGREQGTG